MSKSYTPESNTDAVHEILRIANENKIHVRLWELSDIAEFVEPEEGWTEQDYKDCLEIITDEIDDTTGYVMQHGIDTINDRKKLKE